MKQRKTTKDFVSEANLKHNNFYSYHKTIYCGSKNKLCITCPKHGDFWQEANSHLKGCGCPDCAKEKKKHNLSHDIHYIISKAKEIHGDKYDYSKAVYNGYDKKICIICPKHGEFWQIVRHHLDGAGCRKCSHDEKYNTEEFVKKAKKVHGDKYDYSKVDYVDKKTKVCITCPKHGEFWQVPSRHLSGHGCLLCGLRDTTEEFVKKAKKVHGDKYDYSKVNYVDNRTKVYIQCKSHGIFEMRPNDHLNGQGCPICGQSNKGIKRRLQKEDILKKFNETYDSKYSYDLWDTPHKNIEEKIPILCENHGIFYKTIHQHLQGQGCPKCKSSIMENTIRDFLNKNNIKYEEQKRFDWLVYKKQMQLDFYLPEYSKAIECQGDQHYRPYEHFGGDDAFKYQKDRDITKKKLCNEHNIEILYFSYKNYGEEVITNKKKLLKKIKDEQNRNV